MATPFPWSALSFALLFMVALGLALHAADPIAEAFAACGQWVNMGRIGWWVGTFTGSAGAREHSSPRQLVQPIRDAVNPSLKEV